MKKLLTFIVTVLTIAAVMPVPVCAANADSVMQDAAWTDYVERSMDMDKTPGLAHSSAVRE
ncbi:MAG: hypothetical protein IKQ39_02485 [Oscillospiraceae bacterium]|nr:hypothetical protein [Oscillospiraceae bacterium]